MLRKSRKPVTYSVRAFVGGKMIWEQDSVKTLLAAMTYEMVWRRDGVAIIERGKLARAMPDRIEIVEVYS